MTHLPKITPARIATLETYGPLYRSQKQKTNFVPKNEINRCTVKYLSNQTVFRMIKEGYAIQQPDGGIIRSDKPLINAEESTAAPKPLDFRSLPTTAEQYAAIKQVLQNPSTRTSYSHDELYDMLFVQDQRYEALKDKLFSLLEDL